jgi:hypothetical protein
MSQRADAVFLPEPLIAKEVEGHFGRVRCYSDGDRLLPGIATGMWDLNRFVGPLVEI